jgi:protease I
MPTHGSRIALLVEDGFDDDELQKIRDEVAAAGLSVVAVAPFAPREYTGRSGRVTVMSEEAAAQVRPQMFAAIVVPGGYAPDRLRMRHAVLDLIRAATAASIPVGAIGHGAQVLISAAVIAGRTVTCWPSIAVDVKNAGGLYVDRPVVDDCGLITARKVDDAAAFVAAVLGAIARPR